MIDLLFSKLLFTSGDLSPVCKLPGSRKAAFSLLSTLMKKSNENLESVIKHLNQLLLQSPPSDGLFGYIFTEDLKAPCGYVGLVNQGATCYMNSIMQQFFMNPVFRKGIFSCEYDTVNPTDDLVYQLVYLFSFLQVSFMLMLLQLMFRKAYVRHTIRVPSAPYTRILMVK
jgi:ubiquitin carboxyl-terminal hydrolase 34